MLAEIIEPLWSNPWSRGVGLALMGVGGFFLLVGLVAVPLTWRSDYLLAQHSVVTMASPLLSVDRTLQQVQAIPSQHLFGLSAVQTDYLPISSMQLRLVGVMEADSVGASRVIISEAGRPGKVYQVGDRLSSGVYIKNITRGSVILENEGRMERLLLSRSPLTVQSMPKKLF